MHKFLIVALSLVALKQRNMRNTLFNISETVAKEWKGGDAHIIHTHARSSREPPLRELRRGRMRD